MIIWNEILTNKCFYMCARISTFGAPQLTSSFARITRAVFFPTSFTNWFLKKENKAKNISRKRMNYTGQVITSFSNPCFQRIRIFVILPFHHLHLSSHLLKHNTQWSQRMTSRGRGVPDESHESLDSSVTVTGLWSRIFLS